MHRKLISESEYTNVLSALTITQMSANVMSVISGKHRDHGRVVLLQSGSRFVIIADDLTCLGRHEEAAVSKARNGATEGAVL